MTSFGLVEYGSASDSIRGVGRDHTPNLEEMSISGKRESGVRLDERRFPDCRPRTYRDRGAKEIQ